MNFPRARGRNLRLIAFGWDVSVRWFHYIPILGDRLLRRSMKEHLTRPQR